MIDVKNTILETIKDKMKKLRFLGRLDSKGLKKVLSLIVLDDLYEWSNYLEAPQSVQKKLKDMRNKYILCQRDFIIEYNNEVEDAYVNVNTPQTNSTWLRVWDSENVIELEQLFVKYIQLTDLSETRRVNNEDYLIVDDLTIDNSNRALIVENKVNNDKYIIQ